LWLSILVITIRRLSAIQLSKLAEVIARAGLHCAPHAHQTLGTIVQGVIRFSPSHFTTEEEIDKALEAVEGIALDLR